MTARSTRILMMSAAFLAGLALCFGVVLIVTGRLSSPVAQQIAAIGGPFKLTDQNGQTIPDADRTRALFITVDPERDTPAVIKDYLSSFDPHLSGLTGDPAAIAAVAKA